MSEAWAVKLHGTPETLEAMRATVDGGPAQCAWMWFAPQERASLPSQSAFGNETTFRSSTLGRGLRKSSANVLATATEAKSQAMFDAGMPGTGTATDAIVVAAPSPRRCALEPAKFGGPRSVWGARAARATHTTIAAGIVNSLRVIADEAGAHP